jgi:signal transduction histidine kinase
MERAGWKGGYDINVPKNLQSFQADRRAIKRIFLNLLSNAIEFMAADGKKLLSASASGNFLTLKVSDTGIGIAKKKLATLNGPIRTWRPRPLYGSGRQRSCVGGRQITFEPHSDELLSDS